MFRDVLRGALSTRLDLEQANIGIARDRLNKLDAAKSQGLLDETEYAQARADIENQLAQELTADNEKTAGTGSNTADATAPDGAPLADTRGRWMFWVATPFILAFAAVLYWHTGDMRALDADFVAANSAPAQAPNQVAGANSGAASEGANAGAAGEKLPSIEELLPRLEAHLETEPDDAQGWTLLGTTYLRLRRFKDAEAALGKAHNLLPDDVAVMLQLADARAMLADGSIGDNSLALVERALELEPENIQANWLLGMAAQQRGNNKQAVTAWEKLLPMLAGDPESQQQIRMMISEASGADPGASPAASAANNQNVTDASASPGIEVVVTLAGQLADSVSPQTPVFVYAKAESGPPMPLAVVKSTVADLPLTVRLDDSLAMMPNLKLSSFDKVVVGARASLGGGPVAQTGDFYVEVTGIAVDGIGDAAPVALEIATRVE